MLSGQDSQVFSPLHSSPASDSLPNDLHSPLDGSRFRLGDFVWAKVKSHPWWPGQIFDPSLASSLARKSKRQSHLLVAFFGDSTFGWFLESDLIPFESNFAQKSKQTTAHSFVDAVDDALEEIRRRVELGLACPCRLSVVRKARRTLSPARQKGSGLKIDRQIRESRNAFEPSEMVAFIKDLACSPFISVRDKLWSTVAEAQAHAFRVATFCARSSEYEDCFGNSLQDEDGKSHEADWQVLGLANLDILEMDDQKMSPEERSDLEKSEETDCRAFLDTSHRLSSDNPSPTSSAQVEGKAGSECSQRGVSGDRETQERDVGSKKPLKQAKLTCGTAELKSSNVENKAEGSTAGERTSKCKVARLNGDRSDGGIGTPRSKKTSTQHAKIATTGNFGSETSNSNNDSVSVVNNTECEKLQALPKRSMRFKRLVKKMNAVHVEMKKTLNLKRSVENAADSSGNADVVEIRIKSNERKRERKSPLPSEHSGRPSKLNIGPLITPDTSPSESKMAVESTTEVQSYTGQVGSTSGHVKESSIETAEASHMMHAEHQSDVGSVLQHMCISEDGKTEVGSPGGGNPILISVDSHEMQHEQGQEFQPEKHNLEVNALEVNQENPVGGMEIENIKRGLIHEERRERLMVSGNISCVQAAIMTDRLRGMEPTSQTLKELTALPKRVKREMKSNANSDKGKPSKKPCHWKIVSKRGPMEMDCTPKNSGSKKKRLKTDMVDKNPEHLHHGVNGVAQAILQAGLNSKIESGSRSVHNDMLERQELVECEAKAKVLKLQKDMLPATTNPLDTSIQQGKPLTSISEDCTVTDTKGGEQVLITIESGEQFSNAEASKDVRSEKSGTQEREAASGCRKQTMEDSRDGPSKNSKKAALSSFSKKVSPSSASLRPTIEPKIPARGSKDVSNHFVPFNRHASKVASKTDTIWVHPSRVSSPSQGMALLMKFPPGFALPSEVQLKATFVRFGQLNSSATRVYNNTGCARVVYQDVHDAEAAWNYARKNHVFGQASVNFWLKPFSQTREMEMAKTSFNLKESKSMLNEEAPSLSIVEKQDTNCAFTEGTLMSRGNRVVSDNYLQSESRKLLRLKSCLKKTDDPSSSTAKNGTRVTFQLNCGVENARLLPSTNISGKSAIAGHMHVKSSHENLSGILSDSYSWGSSASLPHFPLPGSKPSFGLPVSSDISDKMMTLLHQVNALVGSSGIVL